MSRSAPEEVDLVSGNPDIDLGLRKTVATAEGEHAVLELRSRAVRFGLITDRQAQELGLAEGGGELGWGKETAKVGERAGGIGHRDAIEACAVTRSESGGAVEDDAPPLSLPRGARDGDVHWCESGVPACPVYAAADAPELGCAGVAEHRVLAASEYRSHPSPLLAERRVAHRINTAMNAVKAPGGDAVRD